MSQPAHTALAALRSRFIQGLAQRLQRIEELFEHYAAGDDLSLPILRREAHSLVGAAGIHQLTALANAAARLNRSLDGTNSMKDRENALDSLRLAVAHPEMLPVPLSGASETPARRLLIVGQGIDELQSLRTLLENAGHEVQAFSSQAEFIAGIDHILPPALLIFGLQSAGNPLAGLAHLPRIRQQWPATRIVTASANDLLTTRQAAYQAGIDLFVAKPFDLQTLLPAIERLLAEELPLAPPVLLYAGGNPSLRLRQMFPEMTCESAVDGIFQAISRQRPGAILLAEDTGQPALSRTALTRLLATHPASTDIPLFWLCASDDDSPLEVAAHAAGACDLLSETMSAERIGHRLAYQARQLRDKHNASRRQQHALYELEQQQLALEHHAVISIADASGTIIETSDSHAQMRGLPLEQLLGSHLVEPRSGHAAPELPPEALAQARQGRLWRHELPLMRPDGELIWVEISLIPCFNTEGEANRFLVARTDVTRRVQSELALTEARQNEMLTAATIQQTLLLPPLSPCPAKVALASRFAASRGVAGDFHELIEHSETCFDVLLGDVMGKGVPAALIGAAVKLELARSLAELGRRTPGSLPEPAAVISALDARLTPRLIELECFVTLSYLRVDRQHSQLTSVGCGHPEALVVVDGQCVSLPNLNLPLGIMPGKGHQQTVHPLPAAAAIVLYSDGLSEAANPEGEQFGEPRLRQTLQVAYSRTLDAECLAAALMEGIHEYCGGPGEDDQTLVVLRLPDERSRHLAFPRQLESMPAVRSAIAELAGLWQLADAFVDRLMLAIAEVFANIVRHGTGDPAYPWIGISLRFTPARIEVSISDHGQAFLPPTQISAPEPDSMAESGYGLYLIHSLCEQVSFHSSPGQRFNACHLTLTQAHSPPEFSLLSQ